MKKRRVWHRLKVRIKAFLRTYARMERENEAYLQEHPEMRPYLSEQGVGIL